MLLRVGDGDKAVVAEMLPTGEANGPLSTRGCTVLPWAWDGEQIPGGGPRGVRLALVPLGDCRRVVHTVPDFADLFLRRGVGASPVQLGDEGVGVREQKYLLNAMCPSSGVPVDDK